MSVTLVVKGGKDVNRRFVLPASVATIGKTPPADVLITDDPLIEPQHFCIERTGEDVYQIRDLGSRHGTWLDGRRINAALLHEHAVVRAGLTVFQVFLSPHAANDAAGPFAATVTVEPPDAARGVMRPASQGEPAPVQPLANRLTDGQTGTGLAAEMVRAGYSLIEPLGKGAFGRVYRATSISSGETVAVKVLDGQPDQFSKRWQLFLREMHVHRRLEHDHIVRLLATCGPEDKVGWFAMEYVAGPSLGGLVESAGTLGVVDACTIVRQVLAALDYAHSFPAPDGPFVHRDVKPSNILIEGDRGHYLAKLCDFGLAKNFEWAGLSGLTATGSATGTISFMSPEQLIDSKYSGPEVDLYATGGVLYYALTGQLMYDCPAGTAPSELLQAVLSGRTVPLRQRRPDLPQELDHLIDRATSHDRVRRFRTAQQMIYAIDQALS